MDEFTFMQIVHDQFTAMDIDGDGSLTKDEMHKFEEQISPNIGKTYNYAEVEQKFYNIDTDRNDVISR